jgi:hypothetical protein
MGACEVAEAFCFCLATRVSKSNVPEVEHYIRRQEEHHHQFNYKQEFLALLRKHGVEYDKRYVWD